MHTERLMYTLLMLLSPIICGNFADDMESSIVIRLLAVFVGSGLGGVCRWAFGQMIVTSWPLGTMVVNVIGCFLLGLLCRLAPTNELVRLLFMTGFCGGFTTFSTFMNENFLMLRSGQLVPMFAYASASLILGFVAAALGYRCFFN